MRENFLRLRYEEDPTILIEDLVNLANTVAGVELHRLPFPEANGQAAKAGPGV